MTFEICAANQASKGKCRPEMDILHTGRKRLDSLLLINNLNSIIIIIIIIITSSTIVNSAGWEKKG